MVNLIWTNSNFILTKGSKFSQMHIKLFHNQAESALLVPVSRFKTYSSSLHISNWANCDLFRLVYKSESFLVKSVYKQFKTL